MSLTLRLHSELVSSFLNLRLALLQAHQPPAALEGLVRASQERRDIEALVYSFEEIC